MFLQKLRDRIIADLPQVDEKLIPLNTRVALTYLITSLAVKNGTPLQTVVPKSPPTYAEVLQTPIKTPRRGSGPPSTPTRKRAGLVHCQGSGTQVGGSPAQHFQSMQSLNVSRYFLIFNLFTETRSPQKLLMLK
jgi:hypothetical protein